jgi:hypothetical protein
VQTDVELEKCEIVPLKGLKNRVLDPFSSLEVFIMINGKNGTFQRFFGVSLFYTC